MYMVIIALVIAIIILCGICQYKTRIIEDYETRLPRLYQEFVDDCIELKGYLELEERASREPKLRTELNNIIDRYSGYYRKEKAKKYEDFIEIGAKKYIKKN